MNKQKKIGRYVVNTYNNGGVTGRQIQKISLSNRQLRQIRNRESLYEVNQSLSLLKIIFVAILLFGVVGALIGNGRTFTFTGFLNTIANAPKIDTNWINFHHLIDLGALSNTSFGRFIMSIISIIQVLLFACVGIAQVVVFLLYFLRLLFL